MPENERGKRSGKLLALRSGIAYIDAETGELLYRGHNIHDIAERLSFEETVFLLWQGRLPALDEGRAFGDELATYRGVPEAVLDLVRITPGRQSSPPSIASGKTESRCHRMPTCRTQPTTCICSTAGCPTPLPARH